jgi:molybdopterin molybdotransferase
MPLIAPEEAWSRLEGHLDPLPVEGLARRRSGGRVLARALAATGDVPASDVSAMDGYALAGQAQKNDRRPVTGIIQAGDAPGFELQVNAAVRIMTGAPVPATAETVVQVEHTDRGQEQVTFTADAVPGANIRRQGEILRTGDQLLAAGSLLTPGALSLIAGHGHSEVFVHRPPTVAFLATGDEVVPPEELPAPGQLRDSHSDFLLAAGRHLDLDFEPLGIAPDRPEVLERMIRQGMSSEVLLVCGGVSQGEFDFVESIVAELGCQLLFDAVAIQPGKPLVAARHDGGWIFGLPGNPASVMVTFWLFVRPLLRRLMGHPDGYLTDLRAGRLGAPLPGAKGRDRFLPAEIEVVDGELVARPVSARGSHDQAAYALGGALVRVRAHAAPAEAGEPCELLVF